MRFYRGKELYGTKGSPGITGWSRSSLYRAIENGTFPKPVHIGSRAVAWRSDDIDAWFASQSIRDGVA
jgi:prophage regulatory protein